MVFTVLINGVNYTDKVRLARWEARGTALEALALEVFNPDIADVDTGREVVLSRETTPVFEGIIYEKHFEYTSDAPFTIRHASVRAYSKLILYDNHIVSRSYTTGTTAGAIITDIAAVISGVNTSNVEAGPSLQQNWEFSNRKALDVLKDVARGTDYLLYMRPGLKLFYKQKTTGTPVKTFNINNVVNAQNNEDNWSMRNRIIYVGKNNQVLADVSEPPGDRPLTISDPLLEDVNEANRRAQTWLNRLKYARREVRLELEKYLVEDLDLGNTVTVDLPHIGVSNMNLFITGIEYPFDVKELYANLICGGELEYFERLLDILEGRDPTSLFGTSEGVAEIVGSLLAQVTAINTAQRIQAGGRTVRVYNKPPMFYENGVNILLDTDGGIRLASGFLNGSFEFSWLPESLLFTRWLRTQYLVDLNEGSVGTDILLPDGTTLFTNIPQDFDIPYYPPAGGSATMSAGEWDGTNAVISETTASIVGMTAIRANATATPMTLIWPKTKNADFNILRYFRIYIYTFTDAAITLRLKQDEDNYLTANISNTGGAWHRWDITTSSMTKTGNPTKMNWMEIITSANILLLDSDYLLYPAARERLRLKFNLSRPNLGSVSPKVKIAKFIWREGKT